MSPHSLHAGTRASGLAAGRHGWDLRLFAWLGGGHGARPRTLWWALACARWSSGPLTLVLLAGAWRTAAPLTVWALTLLLAGVTQYLGKRLAHRCGAPRPFHLGLAPNHLRQGARGGWPSSHALSMACACGALLVLAGPSLPWALALLLTGATGCARVYVGAHFPSDVLVGWALGLLGGMVGATTCVLLAGAR